MLWLAVSLRVAPNLKTSSGATAQASVVFFCPAARATCATRYADRQSPHGGKAMQHGAADSKILSTCCFLEVDHKIATIVTEPLLRYIILGLNYAAAPHICVTVRRPLDR